VAINTLLRNGDSTDELFLVGRRRRRHHNDLDDPARVHQPPSAPSTGSPLDW